MIVSAFYIITLIVFVRFIHLIIKKWSKVHNVLHRTEAAKTLIILGSGGHTAEMLKIVDELQHTKNYQPRFYVIAETDTTSVNRIQQIESDTNHYQLLKIPRSRHVGQSYFSSIFTTFRSIASSLPIVYRTNPDLILCNGPGTCVPICLIAFLFELFFINTNCKIVFIESYCRVKSISLTGKLLIWITDLFVVQWPQLTNYSSKVKYIGKLY